MSIRLCARSILSFTAAVLHSFIKTVLLIFTGLHMHPRIFEPGSCMILNDFFSEHNQYILHYRDLK